MKNYVQDGETLALVAPANVTSGEVVVSGSLVGVALTDAASGELVAVQIDGVVEIKKEASLAITQGAKVYYDTTAKEVDTTNTNTFIGYAAAAAAGSEGTAKVLLVRSGS